jgi:hypothetical protein
MVFHLRQMSSPLSYAHRDIFHLHGLGVVILYCNGSRWDVVYVNGYGILTTRRSD